MKPGKQKKQLLKLPKRIVTRRDVVETIREVEALRDNVIARQVSGSNVQERKATERLKAFVDENHGLSLDENGLVTILEDLRYLVDHAPVMRFIFAGEPEPDFMQELIEWVRSNIDPSSLILYSVQPQIAGGFILTTDRQRYDHSWRNILRTTPITLNTALAAESTT